MRFGQLAGTTLLDVDEHEAESAESNLSRKPDNILLALVDWVERGRAPETITGQSEDGKSVRMHCRYPQRSVWDGKEYICIS